MKANLPSDENDSAPNRAALLWDESFLWGVMAQKALTANRLACDLIRSDDIRKGRLADYELLFVPGGWASNKQKVLGSDGAGAIRRFVEGGGSYLGLCGGAGLATEDGIGLLPVKRRPTKERVPSFSGPIAVKVKDHVIWKGLQQPVFHAWWPSQFVVDHRVAVLAQYGDALPDAFSSDVNVGDAERGGGWAELERVYGINLDPKRLLGEPAVIEGRCGKGRVVLSLLHFDTPDDRNGAVVLNNLWTSLGGEKAIGAQQEKGNQQDIPYGMLPQLMAAVRDLVDLGRRNFLWFQRNPMLFQWRRGVRGLEYCTLFVLMQEMTDLLSRRYADGPEPGIDAALNGIKKLLMPFLEKAGHLLIKERYALQNGHITYEQCDDHEIQALRDELFSRSKSHGGMFKEILDDIDRLYFRLLSGR